MALGMAVSSRIFDGLLTRAWFFEIHKFLSLAVILAILFHALIMLPDPYASFTVDELLVPFRSHLQPYPLALGIISLYGLTIITMSFYLTRLIGQKVWRLLHYLTFPACVMAILHGVLAGTDSELVEARYFHLGVGLGLLFLVMYRILALRNQKKLQSIAPKTARMRPGRTGAESVVLALAIRGGQQDPERAENVSAMTALRRE
jgi:predicted ferric reductase